MKRDCNSITTQRRKLRSVIRQENNLLRLGKTLKQEYMQDGYAVIHVDLSNTELYHPLSMGDQRTINDDIYGYIEQSANLVPALISLKIVFSGIQAAPSEQEEIRARMKKHYSAVMQDFLWDKRKNMQKMLYMVGVGLIFLTAYLMLALSREDNLFLELLSVIGSFSLWEAANCFLVERKNIQRELMDTAQYMTAEIVFESAV